MKNKLTFSLNYRKPKSQYNKNDELIICIRQYSKNDNQNKGRVKKVSTGVKCKLKDWDQDWHLKESRLPIKDSDPDFKSKNRILEAKLKDFSNRTHKQETNKLYDYDSYKQATEIEGINPIYIGRLVKVEIDGKKKFKIDKKKPEEDE